MPHSDKKGWNQTIPVDVATECNETFAVTIQRLAALPRAEYEQVRKSEAKRFNMRAVVLDQEVAAIRSDGNEENDLGLRDPEPWPAKVNGSDLLDEIISEIRKYVVLPLHESVAVALWVIHTHCFDIWQHTPRLAIASPEKGCGKSTLLDVLAPLVPRAIKCENLTAAVLFRVIESHQPCLLVDEVDTFIRDNEELRGILNSGHRRGGKTLRCEGDNNAVRSFNTFAPVATGGIGKLPGTLEDRSIPITLQKRKITEPVADFRGDRVGHLHDLASQAARWTLDNTTPLSNHDPDIPDGIFNRLADNWRPLLAIADIAGGDWPQTARLVAVAISDRGDDAETTKIKLLSDIRQIFDAEGESKLPSKHLAERLADMEDRPWPEWKSGKPISAPQVARLLKPFGITPGTIRWSTDTAKGYRLESFAETFARYLPPLQTVTTSQVNVEAGLSHIPKRHTETDVTFSKTLKGTADNVCDGVTVQNPQGGDNDVWSADI